MYQGRVVAGLVAAGGRFVGPRKSSRNLRDLLRPLGCWSARPPRE
jgi:hypothetical protein